MSCDGRSPHQEFFIEGQKLKRVFSSIGLWTTISAFILGSGAVVVSPPTPAYATDTATYLGVVEVDCSAGELKAETIVYTGGVGDTFKLLSSSGRCTLAATSVLTGEPTELVANVPSGLITVVSAGEFVISDATSPTPVDVTFKTVAGPVFGNHNRGTMPEQLEEFSCNVEFSSSVRIYYQAINDTFKIQNTSGSRTCTAFSGLSSVVTGLPTSLATEGAGDTSGVITIKGPGTFTATSSRGGTITFTVVEGAQPPIGSGLALNGSVTYTDVFYSVATGVVDAKVTLVSAVNITSAFILDDTISPTAGNWALAPDLTVFNSAAGEGSARVKIEFFQTGTSTPVSLTNLSATVVDVDNYQFMSAIDVDTYELSSSPATKLVASKTGNLLTVREPVGEGSSKSDQDHWVVMNFDQASSLEFTFGDTSGSASFGLNFATASWSTAPTVLTAPVSTSGSSTPAGSTSAVVPQLAKTGSESNSLAAGIAVAAGLLIAGFAALIFVRRKAIK